MKYTHISNPRPRTPLELIDRLDQLVEELDELERTGSPVPQGLYMAIGVIQHEVNELSKKTPEEINEMFKADKDMQQIKPFDVVPFEPQQTQEDSEPICPGCGEPCHHTPQEMQGFAYDALEQASKDFSKDAA